MGRTQFLLYNQQKPMKLKAEKVALYRRSQIIEAYSDKNQVYYLFFYKNQLLTATKATKLRRQSFIEHAFKKGMLFKAPHPFIQELLSSNAPCHITRFEPLLTKLKKFYTPQEQAFILTFFDSFISKKQLFNEIKSVYYDYRREGKMFLSYQIIRILKDFAPNNSMVKQLSNDLAFKKISDLYDEEPDKLLVKDQLFAEKILFNDKDNDASFEQLVEIYEKDSSWLDLIALYIDKLLKKPTSNYYKKLKELLELHFDEQNQMYLLESLSHQLSSSSPLKVELFNKYVKTHHLKKIASMISDDGYQLSELQTRDLGEKLEHLDVESASHDPEAFLAVLKPVIDLYPDKADMLLKKCFISLLKDHEVTYIQKLLHPFRENHENLQVLKKIDKMQIIEEDLDQMQRLGELYYEFEDLDKAIECFSWEMELKPTNPKPLQWLSKVYRDKGMKDESNAYQQLCISMQKQA
ncbi:hypothetical protein [Aquibacillus albus]|uniref:Tetratricopeptide repeat protein n=1 Tax=Aquibacillus albus TaxID=1168171 RepID=A0ABS2N3U5_9BACI|nr:hypothetical protein [Aquibacillus albus]